MVVFTVKDNGPGIPAKIQARIFEPFISYGKSTGSGLGLSIVKKIVESHNGEIRFTSQANKGTTFRIFIPL